MKMREYAQISFVFMTMVPQGDKALNIKYITLYTKQRIIY
jgi:hypothetical protein